MYGIEERWVSVAGAVEKIKNAIANSNPFSLVRIQDGEYRFIAVSYTHLDVYKRQDKDHGLFTDQRWCDLVPAIFDKVKILKQPNLDVASWNIYGRNLEKSSANDMSSILIDGYPLLTYHYSGTGPTGVHRYVRDIMRPTSGVAAELERHYEAVSYTHLDVYKRQ